MIGAKNYSVASSLYYATDQSTAYFDPKSESRNERAARLKAEAAATAPTTTAENAIENGATHVNGNTSASGDTIGAVKGEGLEAETGKAELPTETKGADVPA
jgi:hypothetical protein